MKKIILLLLSAFLCSCSDDVNNNNSELPNGGESGAYFMKNFIEAYVFPNEVISYNFIDRYIRVEMKGREIGTDVETKEYEELSEKYNDTDFNTEIAPGHIYTLAIECSGIDVMCDKDLDSAHPAGSSLNDLINLGGISYKEFIVSRYNQNMEIPEWPEGLKPVIPGPGLGDYPLYKPLDELTPNDLVLIKDSWYLHLVGIPSGTYRFTITVKFADGGEPLVSTLETTVQ